MVLFDIVMKVVLYQDKSEVPWLTIDCPDNGPKPHMTLNTTQVQGGICFQTKLTIHNLAVSQPDIRRITRMVITVGYRGSFQQVLDCPVLTSYLASPMPDSEVVISGVAVGSVHGLLTPKKINMFFTKPKVTVGDLVRHTLDAVSSPYTVIDTTELDNRPDLSEKEISVSVKSLYADNGLALVNWLNTQLDVISNKTLKIFVNNNKVVVRVLDKAQATNIVENVHAINVDYVTDAKFTGALLQVTAPWNPEITPGGVIKMEGNFYEGESLPNELAAAAYLSLTENYKHMYTVIMMSYNVDTNGDASMSFSALKTDSLLPSSYNMTSDIEAVAKEIANSDATLDTLADEEETKVIDVYYPSEPPSSEFIVTMYKKCKAFSQGGISRWTNSERRKLDVVAIIEKKFGKEPILTIDEDKSKQIVDAAKADDVELDIIPGFEITPGMVYPFVYGVSWCKYQSEVDYNRRWSHNKMEKFINPVSDKKAWSMNKHWSDMNLYVPNDINKALNPSLKSFWKDALETFQPGTIDYIVCGVLAYVQ